ncbi:AAA family ATPase [Paenibacillus amylolyticus]|uniref:ATP-binding protein n=1 Tax=Paenibacillus amylolyticus TaxID=1451 RepID=UPI001059E4F3|nr:ATP-binding protein [Paenibacillus amylolyticus]TDL70015.1 AAA family ATPase [Paenibacillus amylolyticus]
MNSIMKKNYIERLSGNIRLLNSIEFEQFGHKILQSMIPQKLNHKGQNLTGAPIGYTVDSYTDNLEIIGEYSVDNGYFGGKFEKPLNDVQHALKTSNYLKQIHLFSNQYSPPKGAISIREQISELIKIKGLKVEVVVYDAVDICNYILDSMIMLDTINELLNYLPDLRSILSEYNITNMIPLLENTYMKRKEEETVKRKMEIYPLVYIHGISGIGKSSLLISIAHQLKKEFDITIWINASNGLTEDSLSSYYMEKAGFKQNILSLVSKWKTLLIIDGLEAQQAKIVDQVKSACKTGSKIMISSQVDEPTLDSDYRLKLDFLDESLSMEILNHELSERCPDKIKEIILAGVNGHPLLLSIINRMIKHGVAVWDAIAEDASMLISYPDDNGQAFCSRLLETHLKTIDLELSTLRWLKGQYFSESLLISMIGNQGIHKLKVRNLLNTSNLNAIKIHDIVYQSIIFLAKEKFGTFNFLEKLTSFFEKNARVKDHHYFKALHIHKELLQILYYENPSNFILLYAVLHHAGIEQLNELIPIIGIESLLNHTYSYKKHDYFRILSYIESSESFYRLTKRIDEDQAKVYLKEMIEVLEQLSGIPLLALDIKMEVIHHLGKCEVFSKNDGKALLHFNNVIKSIPDAYHSKLQMVRLLRRNNVDLAKRFLEEIFEAFQQDPRLININTVLSAFNELKEKEFSELAEKYLYATELFEQSILISSFHNFDHPFNVLTRIGKEIGYRDPRRLVKILEKIPIPSEQTEEPHLLFYAGQLYKELGRCYKHIPDQEDNMWAAFQQSRAYFQLFTTTNQYELTKIAELYILMNQQEEALNQLKKVEIMERGCFWYYDFAKIQYEFKQYRESIISLEKALSMVSEKEERYRSTFLFLKGKSSREMGESTESKIFFEEALKFCNNDKFKGEIEYEMNFGFHK